MDKDDLVAKLNKSQIRQLVMITAIFRDILFAQKLFLLIKSDSSSNEVEIQASSVNRWAALILLASKIYAAVEFLEEKNIDKGITNKELKDRFDDIMKVYNGKVRYLFEHIRHGYGSHYGHRPGMKENFCAAVQDLPEIKMWLCTTLGNDVFSFASLLEVIEILEFMEKEGFEGAVQVEKDIFSPIVSDKDRLWHELIKNKYLNDNGIIQKEFTLLTGSRDMKIESGYTSTQKDDIYSTLKHNGLYNELGIIAGDLSGKLDDFFKRYLKEEILKGIKITQKRIIRTKVPVASAIKMPVFLAFLPDTEEGVRVVEGNLKK